MLAPIGEHLVGAGDGIRLDIVGDRHQPATGLQHRRPLQGATGGIAEGIEEIAVAIALGRVGRIHDGQGARALVQYGAKSPLPLAGSFGGSPIFTDVSMKRSVANGSTTSSSNTYSNQ